jgi:hypothetical protein
MIILENGKYKIYERQDGCIVCDRYGEPWQEFVGDKMMYLLYVAYMELKTINEHLENIIRGEND